MKNPFLTADHVYLRTITKDDLTERYRDWFNDPDACAWNSHYRFPNYDEDMRAYYESTIKSRSNLILAICDKETDAHIGNVSLQDIDHLNRSAEFAIMIGEKAFWGKGIGKEAMKLIVGHGFRELNLHRIMLGTAEDNVGMQKLALALGFMEEGRSREAMWKGGKWKSLVHYGLLESEWKE